MSDITAVDIGNGQIIAPQATRYRFDGFMPLRVGDIATIVVEGDNSFSPWKPPTILCTRRVILLADPSGRQRLVECK